MKLNIITSTLNIDNVLSSESISPESFYGKRSFGYKFFEAIPNVDFPKDRIVLFDYLPYIDIVDDNRINYPVVLEIDDNNQLCETVIQKEGDGVYSLDRTLYINPYNCRILFFSVEAINEIELRCSDSKTNKMYRYFHKAPVQIAEAKNIAGIDFAMFKQNPIDLDDCNRKDEMLDSKKGFQLGWYLGAGKSMDSDLAKLKSIERKTYDYVSAIQNNNGIISPAYLEALKELDDEFKNHDPNIKKAQSLWDEAINTFCPDNANREKFDYFLKSIRMEHDLKTAFLKARNIRFRRAIPIENWESYMDEMTRYTNTLLRECQPKYGFYLEENKNSSLYDIILDKLFIDEKFSFDELRVNRVEVSRRFIAEVKRFIETNGQIWENGEEYLYLRSLMLNVSKSEPFDFSYTEDDVLKSVAAFLLKGDDYEEMMNFLQNNAMSNYRYVLGFWGAACGYADMPRNFARPLFESSDIMWISKVYKQIHKDTFGFELEGTLDRTPKKEQKPIIPEELVLVFSSEAFKKLSPPAQQFFKTESLKLYPGKIDKAYIEALKKLEYPKSKTNWQNAIKVLNQKQKKSIAKMNTDTLSLFPVASTGLFLTDFDFLTNSTEFRNLVSAVKGWENDLKWFIDAHNPNHEGYKYYQGKPTDNESVIKQFIFLKKEKYKNTESFLRRTYLK